MTVTIEYADDEQLRRKCRAILLAIEPWVSIAQVRAQFGLTSTGLNTKLFRFRQKFGDEAFPIRRYAGRRNISLLQVTPELEVYLRKRGHQKA